MVRQPSENSVQSDLQTNNFGLGNPGTSLKALLLLVKFSSQILDGIGGDTQYSPLKRLRTEGGISTSSPLTRVHLMSSALGHYVNSTLVINDSITTH
jgi:hypothetical protein